MYYRYEHVYIVLTVYLGKPSSDKAGLISLKTPINIHLNNEHLFS